MHIKTTITPGILKKSNGYIHPSCLVVQDFDDSTLVNFTHALNHVNSAPQTMIPIQIDSSGGLIFALLGILDLLESSEKPILTFTTSYAMSCGAVLLSAGTKGFRYASKNSTILIHEAAGQFEGKKSDVANEMLQMEETNDKLLEILSRNSNKPKSFYKNLIKRHSNSDIYISPKQAVEYGLIDKIGIPTLELEITAKYTIKSH